MMPDAIYSGYLFFDGMACVAAALLADFFRRKKEIELVNALYGLFRALWIVFFILAISDFALVMHVSVGAFTSRPGRGLFIRAPITVMLIWVLYRTYGNNGRNNGGKG